MHGLQSEMCQTEMGLEGDIGWPSQQNSTVFLSSQKDVENTVDPA